MASTGPRTPYVERMKRAGASVSDAPAYASTSVAAMSAARRPAGSGAMSLVAQPPARGTPGPRPLPEGWCCCAGGAGTVALPVGLSWHMLF